MHFGLTPPNQYNKYIFLGQVMFKMKNIENIQGTVVRRRRIVVGRQPVLEDDVFNLKVQTLL